MIIMIRMSMRVVMRRMMKIRRRKMFQQKMKCRQTGLVSLFHLKYQLESLNYDVIVQPTEFYSGLQLEKRTSFISGEMNEVLLLLVM